MKKKTLIILLVTLILTMTSITIVDAKQTKHNYYTLTGTIHNFTYKMKYANGEILKGKGYDVYTSDGSIWQITDTDTNIKFKENTKVKIKLYNNKTRNYKPDDIIVSIKKNKRSAKWRKIATVYK